MTLLCRSRGGSSLPAMWSYLIVLTDPDQRNAIKRFLCRVGYVVIPFLFCLSVLPKTWVVSYKSVDMDAPILWRYHLQKFLGMITLVCALDPMVVVTTWRQRTRTTMA